MQFDLKIRKNLYFSLLLYGIICIGACSKEQSPSPQSPNPNPNPVPLWDPNAMRGVWVTTTASTALDSRENIKQMISNCKLGGINHVFIVVYNNARTIYPSTVMQTITGIKQLEKFVGRDPLQECIE